MKPPKTSTTSLISMLGIMARSIESDDQILIIAIAEAAERLAELRQIVSKCADIVRSQQFNEHLSNYPNRRFCSFDILMSRIDAELES